MGGAVFSGPDGPRDRAFARLLMQFATRVLWFGSRSSLRVLKLVVPTRVSPFGWASGGARPGAAQWASGGARQEACASLGLGRARGNGRYKTSDLWHVGVEFVHPRFKTKTSFIIDFIDILGTEGGGKSERELTRNH